MTRGRSVIQSHLTSGINTSFARWGYSSGARNFSKQVLLPCRLSEWRRINDADPVRVRSNAILRHEQLIKQVFWQPAPPSIERKLSSIAAVAVPRLMLGGKGS